MNLKSNPLHRLVARTPRPLQPLRNLALRPFGGRSTPPVGDCPTPPMGNRATTPIGDCASAQLARELMQELEDEQVSPLLLNIATGFPSALLCVLAAGLLAGALAGREVSVPTAPTVLAQPVQAPVTVAAAVMAGRHALLQELEMQALSPASTSEQRSAVSNNRTP